MDAPAVHPPRCGHIRLQPATTPGVARACHRLRRLVGPLLPERGPREDGGRLQREEERPRGVLEVGSSPGAARLRGDSRYSPHLLIHRAGVARGEDRYGVHD
uniref:Uncharacterized protein n=1 Tax=Triticum urartu TaxID=4572 RepID=A0A8R7U5P3_TRIUA